MELVAQRTRVALALGSGGARGYAHIGVIEVLEARGCEIVSISGTSMGALIGGLHAAGGLGPYSEWVRDLGQRDVLRLLDLSTKAPGAIRAERILAKVNEILAGALIEDLPIPFTAVATDLRARREVWFQEGPLDAAIRASIALPGFIAPVMMHGRLLADGGLLNPLPIAATAAARADVTVAVSLSGQQAPPAVGASVRRTSAAEDGSQGLRRTSTQVLDRQVIRALAARLGRLRGTAPVASDDELTDEAVEELFEALPAGLRLLDVMEMSLEALQTVVMRYTLAGHPPDLLITVPKASCRTLDFHRAEEMIDLGRRLATEALDGHAASSAMDHGFRPEPGGLPGKVASLGGSAPTR
ncbi:patatin-like phospholipase family protein [Geodermatophilus sp. DSM 44513]|uniref:patatin-like phospholipase family protein n=1 Tax=Geodermatophilus sp. DSM 44513 TaxID=1528104 RepID=UPI001277342D|nr:patatin-like phospholipase family protein [Geodermatophilus sp. DSM 44513]WNV75260.1 patatin-like phospholipase family protein [Geodermatophilus sp. DSM 44513]